MSADPFVDELIALDGALGGEFPLIVGGGYGLVLRQRHLRAVRARTRRPFPAARSTQDIDLFLTLEMLLDLRQIQRFRAALDAMGYVPVESAKYYQFVREMEYLGQKRSLKIDLLARVPEASLERAGLKADVRRVRNRSFRMLHAHATPEALTVEQSLLPLTLSSGGQGATVFIPHPFSYLLLKLFALRDQLHNVEKRFGRYHAFDIFSTIAMTTRAEWEGAIALRNAYASAAPVVEAREIVAELFGSLAADGVQRLAEHAAEARLRIPAGEMNEFRHDLAALFGIGFPLDEADRPPVDSRAGSG